MWGGHELQRGGYAADNHIMFKANIHEFSTDFEGDPDVVQVFRPAKK